MGNTQAAISAQAPKTSSAARNKRLMIYYGTDNMAKLKVQARKELGLLEPGAIIPMDLRKTNFKKFAKNNFSKIDLDRDDAFDVPQYEGPAKTSEAYYWLKRYSETEYGALMIARALKRPSFKIRTMNGQAQANTDYISLPADFPRKSNYPSGEKIVPLAVIHHEFEHTLFGTVANKHGSIQDELVAVRALENPVRILHGEEPRYTYYQAHSLSTINIITGKIKQGKWKHDDDDPRQFARIAF